jgi:hypothetical protein
MASVQDVAAVNPEDAGNVPIDRDAQVIVNE